MNSTAFSRRQINLYRIIQESVNNIVKHSGATEAAVAVKKNSHSLQITIHDNGKGFNLAEVEGRRGFGLIGISERARILGAKHRIHSVPGQGTTVGIKLTLKDASDEH